MSDERWLTAELLLGKEVAEKLAIKRENEDEINALNNDDFARWVLCDLELEDMTK